MMILSDEQKLIRNSAERFVDEQTSFSKRQQICETDEGFCKDQWQQFSDLGWLGIALPEQYGGFGGTLMDAALIQQQLGRTLLRSPYVSTIGAAVTAIKLVGNESQKQFHLGEISNGNSIISCALHETESPDGSVETSVNLSDPHM